MTEKYEIFKKKPTREKLIQQSHGTMDFQKQTLSGWVKGKSTIYDEVEENNTDSTGY